MIPFPNFDQMKALTASIKAALAKKQNKLTGTSGQIVGFGADGTAQAQDSRSAEFTGTPADRALFVNSSVAAITSKYGTNRSAVTLESGAFQQVFSNCVISLDNTEEFIATSCFFDHCYINLVGNEKITFADCFTNGCQIGWGKANVVLEFSAGDCYNSLIYTSVKVTAIRFVNCVITGNILPSDNGTLGLFDSCFGNYPDSLNNMRIPYQNHENLLDNWYFPAVINQRGKTEYTEAGYTIDRYRSYCEDGSPISFLVQDGYITISSSGSPMRVFQDFETPLKQDQQYTVSFLSLENHLYTVSTHINFAGWLEDDIWINLYGTGKALEFTVVNKTLNLVAAKLELGDHQTLAHKEGDTWVLNDPPPDPALELAKCQRYFQAFDSVLYLYGFVQPNKTEARAPIYFPVKMRANPTAIVPDGTKIQLNNSLIVLEHDTFFFGNCTRNQARLLITVPENASVTALQPTVIQLVAPAGAPYAVAFSSEL